MAQLQDQAGQATVAQNLEAAADSLLGSPVLAVHSMISLRPSLAERLRESSGDRSPNLGDLEKVFAAYLEEEKKLGRIVPGADCAATALAIVATIHRVLMTSHADSTHARASLAGVLDVLLHAITRESEI